MDTKQRRKASQLSLAELQVGGKASFKELENVFDVMIVLDFPSSDEDTGTIKYIGKPGPESTKAIKSCIIAGPVYHRSFEYEDGVVYDE